MEKRRSKKKTKKITKRIPNNERNEMDKTKKYKIKTKKHQKAKKIIKITILVVLLLIIIAAGIVIGKIYGLCKEAKLNAEDVVIKYENSVVKDITLLFCTTTNINIKVFRITIKFLF